MIKILKHKIKNSSGSEQQSFKEDLIGLYDQWIINFPKRKGVSKIGSILSTKAQALIDYKMADDASVYFQSSYPHDHKILQVLQTPRDYIIILILYTSSIRFQT